MAASADRWNRSPARIEGLVRLHDSHCEDMEAAALALVCASHDVPFLTVKDISNNDLLRATDIARAMVTEWGMSDSLGAINYDGHKRNKFLDIPMGPERGAYAEDTARLIDAEVKRIMTDAHGEARRILTEHRDELEGVTRRLLEIEVMEGDELRQMLGAPPVRHPPDDATPLPPGID